MDPTLTHPLDSLLLGAAVVFAVITVAFAVVRAAERRGRALARARSRGLATLFQAFLDGRVRAERVRAAVDRRGAAALWSALEPLAHRLERGQWGRLSEALAGNPHERAERRALREESPWRRELAARRLGLLVSPAARRALRRALARGPEPVSATAARSLGRYRDRAALGWILRHPQCLAHRTPRTRVAILAGFGRGALPRLARALRDGSPDAALERALTEVLGLGRHLPAAPDLERRLSAPDLERRVAAARALGRMRASQCGSALMAALRDEAWQVRAQAAWALGRTRVGLAVRVLAERLTDRSWWVRHHAAYALGELGEEGRAVLRQVASASPDPYARDIAREVLDGGFRARIA